MEGTCPTCHESFKSKTAKKFCSLQCYLKSDQFRKLQQDNNDKKKLNRVCPQCESPVPSDKKYCNKLCRRKYFSSRFDRWIANPESIALPQNFDEFLTREELPCLVSGCGWVGKNLGNHVNFKHGISARDFKILAGFNIGTGLVSEDVHLEMSERTKKMVEEGVLSNGGFQTTPAPTLKNQKPSLEHREHLKKAVSLRQSGDKRNSVCRVCHNDFLSSIFGKKLYCSTTCRSKEYYGRGRSKIECSFCHLEFMATKDQQTRKKNGGKVYCSVECRNKDNPKGKPKTYKIKHE